MNNQRLARLKLKEEVLTHYGGGKCACIKCGQADLACLSIDHIEGGGTREKNEKGIGSYYLWLKKNNYPEGYQTLCMNCQFVKRMQNNELKRDFSYRWTGEKYPAYIGVRMSADLYSKLRTNANDKGKTFSDYLRDCLEYIVKQSQNNKKVVNAEVYAQSIQQTFKPKEVVKPVIATDKKPRFKVIGGVTYKVPEVK